MQQIMIIANQTAVGAHVTQRVHELRGDDDDVRVFVVVPATPRLTSGEAAVDAVGRPIHDVDGQERAARQLRAAVESLEKAGATVTGSVGSADPMRAAQVAAEGRRIDRIIVSTLPVGASRWIAMDLPHRLQRRFKVPVDHVIGQPVAEDVSRQPVTGPVQVLLVEDQPADVALAKQAIQQSGVEAEVVVAKNGAEAVEVIRTYGPDATNLVLLDLKMPVLDGHQFLERIGKEFDLDNINVVVLTTSTNEADRQRAHALGAGAYVVKDPDFEVFSDTITSVLQEAAAG